MKIPRILIAGTKSDIGKTSITLGIILGILKKGYSVQPFKVGPDYIDPSYLTEISNNQARNLDVWLMEKNGILNSFINNSSSNISVIEGVMGFYDGAYGDSDFASTYHVSALLKTPVILILDASKIARSIAAIALGYTKLKKNSNIVGFILNKIRSKKHEDICKQALKNLNLPILGSIYYDNDLSLDSRYLGLLPVSEKSVSVDKIKKTADRISNFLNIDKIIDIASNSTNLEIKSHYTKNKINNVKIAVALDQSFNFYYRDNLDLLERSGAEIKYFSPLYDSKLPSCDGIYIGGGFPEIFSDTLERNTSMRRDIKKLAENGIPIYAECGGLMYLAQSISYTNTKHSMVGVFDVDVKMTNKLKLNYTKGIINSSCLLSSEETKINGHEFHYSEINNIGQDYKFAYELSVGLGMKNKKDGLLSYNTLASYMHTYFNKYQTQNITYECLKYSKK